MQPTPTNAEPLVAPLTQTDVTNGTPFPLLCSRNMLPAQICARAVRHDTIISNTELHLDPFAESRHKGRELIEFSFPKERPQCIQFVWELKRVRFSVILASKMLQYVPEQLQNKAQAPSAGQINSLELQLPAPINPMETKSQHDPWHPKRCD